jgi:Pyridoxamine 5'-phosphate oxidase
VAPVPSQSVLIGCSASARKCAPWGLCAKFYETAVRATGVGWTSGIGRIGAFIGPALGGVFVAAGISSSTLIDSIDLATRQGWSVLIQGPAHHVTGAGEDAVREAGVESWAPGPRELFVRIVPSRITGRRVGAA